MLLRPAKYGAKYATETNKQISLIELNKSDPFKELSSAKGYVVCGYDYLRVGTWAKKGWEPLL